MDRSPPGPSCSGGFGPRPQGTASSGASSWPVVATMGLCRIILSQPGLEAALETDEQRERKGRRGDHHGRRVQRVLERRREWRDKEGIDDRRQAEEEHDQREEEDGDGDRPKQIASASPVRVHRIEGGVRERTEKAQESEKGRDRARGEQ